MISYILGNCEYISEKNLVVSNNGIGYRIFATISTIQKVRLNKEVKLHTFMNVRENEISLYGFLSMEELDMFNLLTTVSGIGPKVALAILDELDPSEISMAIISDDIKTLTRCSGVGKKTAQRMVLELKDKLGTIEISDEEGSFVTEADFPNHRQEAIEALVTLGYSRSESMKAVMQVAETDMNTEDILKLSLKKLSSL